jgi:1-acyl-sn-glycerol-3-phosphate acyltransferase
MSIAVLPKASRYPWPKDGKTSVGYAFWNFVNELVVVCQFKNFEVVGIENLPADGPFLLIANHSKRWDGPVVQYLLNRRANYMVSPNEMRGLQGVAVMSVGAFPANPRLDPVGYAVKQLRAGEPVVVFPEGNIFYDDDIHPFKPGAAKIIMTAASAGQRLPVIPAYISYGPGKLPSTVKITIGKPIALHERLSKNFQSAGDRHEQREVSQLLFDEVAGLRDGKANRSSDSALDIESAVSLQCTA